MYNLFMSSCIAIDHLYETSLGSKESTSNSIIKCIYCGQIIVFATDLEIAGLYLKVEELEVRFNKLIGKLEISL